MIELRRLMGVVVVAIFLGACGSEPVTNETITMKTSLGDIEIEILGEQAPITAANFLRLVDGGHLDGATFYRVVSPANDNGSPVISVIQGGLGSEESPFSPIEHETTEQTGISHVDGTLSMARAAVGTATNEFFITIGDQPALDFGASRNADEQGFAAFGRVLSGGEVVRAIHNSPASGATEDEYVSGQILSDPVQIISVSRQ